MKEYIVKIEKEDNDQYVAYNEELGMLGGGEDIEDCKESAYISLEDIQEDFTYRFELVND